MPRTIIESIDELKRRVGQEVGVSDWFEVTQPLINAFADATQDRQWIHIDPDRARVESPYKTTIAHGFLTLSLLSRLRSLAFEVRGNFKMGINYGLNRVRFPAPVPSGARIRGRFTVQSVEDIPNGVQLVLGCIVEVEGSQKPALAAEWLLRYYLT